MRTVVRCTLLTSYPPKCTMDGCTTNVELVPTLR
jgi:hypothetical protein